MRILITGHKGYIGPVMVRMLLAEGHELVGMDSDLFAECAFNQKVVEIPELKKDIRDATLEDFRGMDAVIHLAGISNDPIGNLNPDLTYEINHRASVRLAALAKEAGCSRFLFSSSCSTYGAAGEDALTEQATFNPVTPYGHSKVLVEQDVTKLAGRGFSPIFLRNATAYGVSPQLRFDLVINNLVAYAYTSKQVLMKSDGTPWRPVVHIEDISHAFIAALVAPLKLVHNQAFNVGRNEENYRIRDLAEIVAGVVPGCEVKYDENAGPDKRTYRVNFDKIRQTIPGFQPEWDARRGALELLTAYRKANLTWEQFDSIYFKRIDYIKQLIATGQLGANLRWSRN
jgi:nucleoside-diphosphate-sugar epimerase